MDLFRKCMEPVEKCLRDAKMDKSSVRCSPVAVLWEVAGLPDWPFPGCRGGSGLAAPWRTYATKLYGPHQPFVEQSCHWRGVAALFTLLWMQT